jgi:RNA-directed DNA polymerase
LALEPVAETQADIHSYGFRSNRNAMDAIEQCFCVLSKRQSAQWILEGDIKACFDNISHEWIKAHIILDKHVLAKWLTAGYVYKNQWGETIAGTPQGGVISPTLANMVLDGMNSAISAVTNKTDKVHLVRYADDFIVTANSKELLENKIQPVIEKFLKERGLTLSEEKTRITHIDEGFDFLGFNIRKYKGKLLTKPSKNIM